jgi:hypothetical protein
MRSDHERMEDDSEGGSAVAQTLVDGAALGQSGCRGSVVLFAPLIELRQESE